MASKEPVSGRAAVFINWTIPYSLGHVGWGYRVAPDVWYYGGLETAGLHIGENKENNTHNIKGSFKDMMEGMRNGKRPGDAYDGYPYHDYKLVTIPAMNVANAHSTVEKIRNGGYFIKGNNCMDAVFAVIKAYSGGNDRILPWPSKHPIPRRWYAAIPGKGIFIQAEGSTGNWFYQKAGI